MSRVMKRFFRKLSEPVGFAIYFFVTFSIADYLGEIYGAMAFLAVYGVMLIVPLFGWMLREMYQQAKREIEWENDELMRDLKGK